MLFAASRSVRIGAVLLFLAAVGAMALAGRSWRRSGDVYRRAYANIIKPHDIADTTRSAVSALQDAELSVQDYVLTGETTYSEAWRKDLQNWQDESGTAEIIAQHDPAAQQVKDLVKAGSRVADELQQIVSLFEGGSRDAAIERIRKGSAIVYLEEARDAAGEVRNAESEAADHSARLLLNTALRAGGHLIEAAAALFCLAVSGAILILLGGRERRSAESPRPLEKQSIAAGR